MTHEQEKRVATSADSNLGSLDQQRTTSLRAQLRAAFIVLALGSILLITIALVAFSLTQARESLIQAELNKLTALRSDRAGVVESYFAERQSDMAVLVETAAALRREAFAKQAGITSAKAQAVARLFNGWRADVLDISTDPAVMDGVSALSDGLREFTQTVLSELYLDQPAVDDAGDGSAYSAVHRQLHPFFSNYATIHGYADIILVDGDGNVVYTLQKTPLFATNLASGRYRNTHLGQLYRDLRRARPGQILIADVAPLDGEMAMFMGAPIYAGAEPVGVVAFRLPFTPLNDIIQDRTGLPPSGETYLLGRVDGAISYRSERVVKPARIGDPRIVRGYNLRGLDGFTGQELQLGATDQFEVATYQPLNIEGVNWAIFTTANLAEILSSRAEGDPDDYFTKYVAQYGYYDLLLIDPDGFVFYSVQREAEFETNILTGEYQDTHLAQLIAQVLRTRQYGITDFAPYAPSDNAPAAFVAQPVLGDGRVEFIIVLQLPWSQINALVADLTGLGETGEAYLVGADKLARTQLRFDPQTSLLRRTVDTEAVRQGLNRVAGVSAGISYDNRPTFSAWQPLNIPGLSWVLVTETGQDEALALVAQLRNFILLVGGALLVVFSLLAVIVASALANRLVNPLLALTGAAVAVARGDFDTPVPTLRRNDEIGVLAGAFERMTTRLRDAIASLQASNQQVLARTEQLEANQRAVQVIFSVGGTVKADELLGMVVNLIRDRFNLYHVQIYLLDEAGENAVLRQSTGFAGQQLLARKHHIPLERASLVTTAIRENRPVLVADVSQDPNFLPNPLLPDTRSELTVPLRIGEQVVGVLDAQSRDIGFFTEDTITLFETMTDQIGLLFQNSRLFTDISEKTEQLTIFTNQLATAAEIARRISNILDPEYLLTEVVELLKSRFGLYHVHVYLLDEAGENLTVAQGSGEVGRVLRERRHTIPLSTQKSLVARAARERQSQLITDTALESDFMPNPLLPQTRSELAVPLLVGNKVLGVLDMQDDQAERFGKAERDTFGTLAGQIAGALENARLFEAQKRAEAAIKDLARQNQLVLDSAAEGIFGVNEKGETVFVNPAAVRMLGFSAEELLGSVHHDLIHHHRADGSVYPAHECKVYAAYRDGKTHAGEDEIYWRKDGTSFPVAYTSTPIKDELGKILGAVVTFRDISAELAAREAIEKRARELQTVAEVSTAAASSLDPTELLSQVVELTKERFDLYHAHIYLYDAASHTLKLAAGAGEAGKRMLAEGWSIPADSPTSLVARAFRTREGVIANNVKAAPDFLPNPHLPETASELAVPLIVGDDILGVLDVQSTRVGRFTEADVAIKTTLARQVATALENARLFTEQLQLTAIVNTSTDFIATTDLQGVLTYVNPAGVRLSGYESADEMLGKVIADFHLPEDLQRVQQEGIPTAFKEGVWRGENRILRRDGTLLPVEQTIFIIRDEDGHPRNLATIMSDITERKAAEEAIRASEARFRDVATSAIGWVWEVDAQGRYIYCSEKSFEVLGYTPAEMLGKTPFDFMLPSEVERIAPGFAQIVQTKSPIVDLENWNRRKDGTEVCLLTNGVPMLDAEGNLIGFRGVDTDITERKRAEQEIRKRAAELQTVAEVSTRATSTLDTTMLLQNVVDLTKERFDLYHAHIYLVDRQGRNLVLAAGAGEIGQQMVAEGWRIPVDSGTSLVARAFRTREGIIANDVQAAPDFLPNPHLPETASELAVPLIVGDKVLGVLDVQSTRVGRFTEADIAIKTTLARQIATALENARLFEETQGVAEKLREVDRLKSEFLANMSHELRTPLNSILGYTQLLLLDLEGQIDEASYEDLTSIDVNGKHLLNLINDILDLAKIEAGRMELHIEEIRIEPLLENIRSSSVGLLRDKPLTFEVLVEPDLPTVNADSIRLTQVLNNLVSNAIKFTEKGGVTVHAYPEDTELCIAITDTGIGLTEEDLSTIFERFRQVDGSFTRRAEGTGLGLPITQHLVNMHGGRLEVRSVYGEGSTFTVRLPANPATPSA